MSERETKKLTTPSGKEIELKTFLTARERNQVRAVVAEKISLDVESGESKLAPISGELLERMAHTGIEIAVVSFNGSSENILERILDGSPEDYDFIVAETTKVGNFKQAK